MKPLTGSRGYYVCRNITLHQQVNALIVTNSISIDADPYWCKIIIKREDRNGDVTIGYMPRELSRFEFYLIHEGGWVTGTVANIIPRPSPILEGGFEIPIPLHFIHKINAILKNTKTFAIEKIHQMHEKFEFDQVIEGAVADEGGNRSAIRWWRKTYKRKITLLLLIDFMNMFKKIKNIDIQKLSPFLFFLLLLSRW